VPANPSTTVSELKTEVVLDPAGRYWIRFLSHGKEIYLLAPLWRALHFNGVNN